MAQRCCLYKYGQSYFVICTNGTDCPPLPDAENVSWWTVEDCHECKVPTGYPVPAAPEKPTPPCGGTPHQSKPEPALIPVTPGPDLGSAGWECDDDLKQVFSAAENMRLSIFVEPCPGSSIEVVAAKKVRTEPPDIVTVNRPQTVNVTGNTVGLQCKRGQQIGRCRYRIVEISAI